MKSTTAIHNLILASALAALFGSSPLRAECKAGAYTIFSGDTMEYQGERIHLKGVMAPGDDAPYAVVSEKALQTLIVMNCPVKCFVSDRTKDGEAVAVCYGGDESDINAAMVREGYAKADPAYPDYRALEEQAKAEKLGIWSDTPPQPTWTWPTRDAGKTDRPTADKARASSAGKAEIPLKSQE